MSAAQVVSNYIGRLAKSFAWRVRIASRSQNSGLPFSKRALISTSLIISKVMRVKKADETYFFGD